MIRLINNCITINEEINNAYIVLKNNNCNHNCVEKIEQLLIRKKNNKILLYQSLDRLINTLKNKSLLNNFKTQVLNITKKNKLEKDDLLNDEVLVLINDILNMFSEKELNELLINDSSQNILTVKKSPLMVTITNNVGERSQVSLIEHGKKRFAQNKMMLDFLVNEIEPILYKDEYSNFSEIELFEGYNKLRNYCKSDACFSFYKESENANKIYNKVYYDKNNNYKKLIETIDDFMTIDNQSPNFPFGESYQILQNIVGNELSKKLVFDENLVKKFLDLKKVIEEELYERSLKYEYKSFTNKLYATGCYVNARKSLIKAVVGGTIEDIKNYTSLLKDEEDRLGRIYNKVEELYKGFVLISELPLSLTSINNCMLPYKLRHHDFASIITNAIYCGCHLERDLDSNYNDMENYIDKLIIKMEKVHAKEMDEKLKKVVEDLPIGKVGCMACIECDEIKNISKRIEGLNITSKNNLYLKIPSIFALCTKNSQVIYQYEDYLEKFIFNRLAEEGRFIIKDLNNPYEIIKQLVLTPYDPDNIFQILPKGRYNPRRYNFDKNNLYLDYQKSNPNYPGYKIVSNTAQMIVRYSAFTKGNSNRSFNELSLYNLNITPSEKKEFELKKNSPTSKRILEISIELAQREIERLKDNKEAKNDINKLKEYLKNYNIILPKEILLSAIKAIAGKYDPNHPRHWMYKDIDVSVITAFAKNLLDGELNNTNINFIRKKTIKQLIKEFDETIAKTEKECIDNLNTGVVEHGGAYKKSLEEIKEEARLRSEMLAKLSINQNIKE